MKYRLLQFGLAGLSLALAACTVVSAAESNPSPRFDLQRFDVRGNTLLLAQPALPGLDTPGNSSAPPRIPPGLYVQAVDGLIRVTNPVGATNFTVGHPGRSMAKSNAADGEVR